MRRRLAREIALQSLYHLQMNDGASRDAIAMAIEEAEHENEAELDLNDEKITPHYIEELVEGTLKHKLVIDDLLSEYLKSWRIDRLSKVDREVLRLATYEMIYRDDVPPKVVVNEAIDLAKHFGTEESGKFVNGVLGKMIRELDAIKQKSKQL
ncbi:MAG: transcription antitermination factor NusB [Paenibacillaceae bacterium]|uniref:transcription antitermination factor NusB n=1 Tax=Paenibacillus cymbidii TaxID=1639034 RepID=UPI00107FD6B7|nr:transcription antitermination factor NusB [Paenibacillus cymbidii]MBO9609045.1 transcription antitermination factor NusB [Paenibacillaceae bacterium]